MAERIFDLNLKAVSQILRKEFGKDCLVNLFDISVYIWKIAAINLNIDVDDDKFVDFIDKSVRPQDIEGFYRLTIDKNWGEETNDDPDSIINKIINTIYNLVDEVEPEIERLYKEYLNN